jgi:hypothetical protein
LWGSDFMAASRALRLAAALVGFAQEDFDNDLIAAAVRADHPRLFRRGICWCGVIRFMSWALRYAEKHTDWTCSCSVPA